MNNYRTIQQKDMHKLFPAWEHNIPTLGTKCSQPGNKTALRLALSLLLMFVLGINTAWGQTEITALSQITDANGNYIITDDISGGTPGVSTFSGTLTAQAKADGSFPVISGLSAPLFTTATNATISNIILDQVSISQGGKTGSHAVVLLVSLTERLVSSTVIVMRRLQVVIAWGALLATIIIRRPQPLIN